MKMFVDRTPEYPEWSVVAFALQPKERKRHLSMVATKPDYVDD